MGFDAVQGPNTYGSGCMPGAQRMFAWFQNQFDAGSLGCYNPASLGGRSLHAEGRAMDIALNANNPAQQARGDLIFDLVMANPDKFGAQEMLWRGFLWSWRNRELGKRFPEQQADHMNHVHLGIDVNAARNWDESWLQGLSVPGVEEDDMPHTPADLVKYGEWAFKNVVKGEGVDGQAPRLLLIDDVKEAVLIALKSDEGKKAIRDAVK